MTGPDDYRFKGFKIGDIFTDAELKRAVTIFSEANRQNGKETIDKVVAEITRPAMERIDKLTGQKNDERYFAYMLEYAVTGGKR